MQYVGYYPQQQAFYQPHVPGMAHFLLHASGPSFFHPTVAYFLVDLRIGNIQSFISSALFKYIQPENAIRWMDA